MLPQPVHAAAQSPVYGKILIPAWRDEPEELAQGLHDAIVSEATFCRVQERFGVDRYGRKQRGHQGGSSIIVPELVLRGHLLCPACSGLLTGSTSRGNGGSYTYYHCHHCKETRFRNEEAHQAFSAYLDEVTIASEVEELYRHILGDLTQTEEMQRRKRLAALKKEQAQLEARLFKADEGFIEDRLAGDSYERLKVKYQDALQRIRVERAELEEAGEGFAEKLRFTVGLLSNLGKVYQRAHFEGKHALIGSIFPEKLTYQNGSFRISPESALIALLCRETQKIKDTDLHSEAGVLFGSGGRIRTWAGFRQDSKEK